MACLSPSIFVFFCTVRRLEGRVAPLFKTRPLWSDGGFSLLSRLCVVIFSSHDVPVLVTLFHGAANISSELDEELFGSVQSQHVRNTELRWQRDRLMRRQRAPRAGHAVGRLHGPCSDLPGHGRSDRPPRRCRAKPVERIAEALLPLCPSIALRNRQGSWLCRASLQSEALRSEGGSWRRLVRVDSVTVRLPVPQVLPLCVCSDG